MADIKDQGYKRLIIFDVFMIVFFGLMLVLGTFIDERTARSIYSPDNTFVKEDIRRMRDTSDAICRAYGLSVEKAPKIDQNKRRNYREWKDQREGKVTLRSKFGIDKGEFRSFPSGHSILSMSTVFILQSLTWFSAKLKDKQFVFGIIGMLFAVVIMFSRMILGAHYLSDVAFGAVISSFIALVYTVIQHKISGPLNPS